MRMNIEPKTYTTGVAVQMSVTVTGDNKLRNEDGTAILNYWLYSESDNIVTNGNVNVNDTFCNGWDGTVNAAFIYIADYLGVIIL